MSNSAWKRENTVQIALRFTRNSGIPEALQKMTEKTGEKGTMYIRRVVTESLIRDGFISEKMEEDK